MQNSQIIIALRALNKEEFKEFGRFVRSPFFNNREEVVRCYDALRKYYPAFKSKQLSEEIIFDKVYPGKKFSGVTMRKLNSLSTNLLVDFLGIKNFKNDVYEYNLKQLEGLHEKNLTSLFKKKAAGIEKLFRNGKHTFQYYENKFKFTYSMSSHLHFKDEKAMALNLQNEIDDFTEYFLAIMSLLYFRSITVSRLYNIKYDLKFFDEVVKYFSDHSLKDTTICWLYFNMAMLTSTVDEKYYSELVNSRNRFDSRLSDIDKYNVYVTLHTYCINKIKTGEFKYRKLLIENTKDLLEKSNFPGGYLPPYTFTGNITVAAALKEFEWADDFIGKFKAKLDPELQDELVSYCESFIEFYKCNYEKSIRHLSTINLDRTIMKLHCKNLLLMNYYELNYHEELISSLDAYRHFLHRDKNISEESRNVNILFSSHLLSLLKVKLSFRKAAVLNFKKEVEGNDYFRNKEWLLKKANELLKIKT